MKLDGNHSLKEGKGKKLLLFYKINNCLVPQYLCDLLPRSVGYSNSYNLRNSDNLVGPFCRLQTYRSSFIPSTINQWNDLNIATRDSKSVSQFKHLISNRIPNKAPHFYYAGERKLTILHARLRNKCSVLKSDLHRVNIVGSAECNCGFHCENVFHYFFECKNYVAQRQQLITSLHNLGVYPVSLDVLLFDSAFIPEAINSNVFSLVQTFIKQTRRF